MTREEHKNKKLRKSFYNWDLGLDLFSLADVVFEATKILEENGFPIKQYETRRNKR